MLKDIEQAGNRIILFIDEIHIIQGAGGAEGSIDAGNILKPSLARGQVRCLGATTIDEYKKHIEKDAALARRFQSILGKKGALHGRKMGVFLLSIDSFVYLKIRFILK